MIEVTQHDGVWRVMLNRPEKANALSLEALHQLSAVFDKAQADTELRGLIVTGTGERVFCAGADLGDDPDAPGDLFAMTRDPVWAEMSGKLAGLPCLTVAALNGTLAGGGFALALACDLRIATPEAKFFYPVLKRGFLPQPADVVRMKHLIGPARSKLILLAGQKLTAGQAYDFGLLDQIAALEDFPKTLDTLFADSRSANAETGAAIKYMAAELATDAGILDCYAAVYEKKTGAIDCVRSNLTALTRQN